MWAEDEQNVQKEETKRQASFLETSAVMKLAPAFHFFLNSFFFVWQYHCRVLKLSLQLYKVTYKLRRSI